MRYLSLSVTFQGTISHDSRFLKECSSECILGRVGCLTEREVVLSGIDKGCTDIEVKAGIWKCDIYRRATIDVVPDYE